MSWSIRCTRCENILPETSLRYHLFGKKLPKGSFLLFAKNNVVVPRIGHELLSLLFRLEEYFVHFQILIALLKNFRSLRLKKPKYSLPHLVVFEYKNILRLSISDAGKAVCLLNHLYASRQSGCRESNSAYLLPKQTYYRYTTPRCLLY